MVHPVRAGEKKRARCFSLTRILFSKMTTTKEESNYVTAQILQLGHLMFLIKCFLKP